ncbi:MAG: superoxide dismutase [Ni], partial [Chloroflexota bacterium]|nr:superoxide dismutase [Ni] [Chloroflexota bacterium]
MINSKRIKNYFMKSDTVLAHCDIPCGIYDPNDAIQAAQTVIRMTELLEELDFSSGPSPSLGNSMARFV